MPRNLNINDTDQEIEHESTGLQTQDPLQCVGAKSGQDYRATRYFPMQFVLKSAQNHVGANATISVCCPLSDLLQI